VRHIHTDLRACRNLKGFYILTTGAAKASSYALHYNSEVYKAQVLFIWTHKHVRL